MKKDKEKKFKKIESDAGEVKVKGRENLKNIRYFIYFSLFIIISVFTFYYIYNIFDKPKNIFIFNTLSIRVKISLIALLIFYFSADGLRLYFVLKTLKCKIKFRNIFKLIFINMFISNITPFATGGGFVQVYYLTKKGISLGDATAATTIRTILATLLIFVIAPFVILTGKGMNDLISFDKIIIYMVFFVILYFTFFYIVIFKNNLIKRIIYNILIFVKNKGIISEEKFNNYLKYLFNEIDIFSQSLKHFFNGKTKYKLASVVFAILFLLAELSFSVLLILGLGYNPDYWLIVMRQVVVIFFMYFAPTPGATGIAEGGFSLVFSNYVKASDMFPLIFSWRFFTKYIGIIIGLIIFFFSFVQEATTNE